MNIGQYFNSNTGTGILSTADKDGNVDSAIYLILSRKSEHLL